MKKIFVVLFCFFFLMLIACSSEEVNEEISDFVVSPDDSMMPLDYSSMADSVGVSENSTAEKYSGENIVPQGPPGTEGMFPPGYRDYNTEEYSKITENSFSSVLDSPISTFSVDVDTASYSNFRRFLNNSTLPYPSSIRLEEMVNYFDYDYPQPEKHPFSVTVENGVCPWKTNHQLLMVGLKGRDVNVKDTPSSNIVLLLDSSGSMSAENKLPLLKQSLRILLDELSEKDSLAIVAYAGSAGLVLPSTPATQKDKILEALDSIDAGGSTAGGEGIQLAYDIAKENFIKNGNNRVILATDGDFNVGVSSSGELVSLIEKKRETGIFLTILGFGMGNYKDNKMEELSNAGNGNYAYIDNILEAKKVLGTELFGSLYTIAKDVKIQIEFNPAFVKSYRLLGYENRILKTKDFNDDKKDAGDIGSGHTVTAFYEIITADGSESVNSTDLEYQKVETVPSENMFTLRLRYKQPDSDVSTLIENRYKPDDIFSLKNSIDFNFASAVIETGLLLRNSEFKGKASYDQVIQRAKKSKGVDENNDRAEFIKLVEKAQLLDKTEEHEAH